MSKSTQEHSTTGNRFAASNAKTRELIQKVKMLPEWDQMLVGEAIVAISQDLHFINTTFAKHADLFKGTGTDGSATSKHVITDDGLASLFGG